MPDVVVDWWQVTLSTITATSAATTTTLPYFPIQTIQTACVILPRTTVVPLPVDEAARERRRQEHEARVRENREHAEQARRDREPAWRKARDLLRSLLDPENQARLDAGGPIIITGSDGNLYHINRGHSGNVYSQALHVRLCAHPPMQCGPHQMHTLPDADAMIAQILALQTDAPGFLRIANRA